MIDVMNWSECERKFIRKVEVDEERIKSIVKAAMIRLNRAENLDLESVEVSLVIEDYYEVIKELLVAYLLKNGMRSKNHQCLISYFYNENPEHEKETLLISQLSFLRNRLNYYGDFIPRGFYEKNKDNFRDIINLLKNKLKE